MKKLIGRTKCISHFIISALLFTALMPTFAYATTDGRVTYDFDPSTDELPTLYSYVSEYAFIDAEEAAKIIFPDSPYDVECYYEENGALDRKECYTENAMINSSSCGYFRYSTENIKYTTEVFSIFREYPTDELAFMSRDDAVALCESTLNKLGVNAQAYDIQSLSLDTLVELSNDARTDLLEWQEIGKKVYIKDDWSTDDECYHIDLYQMIDGIPVSAKGYYDHKIDMYLSGTTIKAIVTRNGIEYVYISSLANPVQAGEAVNSSTMKAALDGYIADKNSELGRSVDLHIVDMYIRYVQTFIPGENVNTSFRMIPSWTLLRAYEQNEDGVMNTYFMDVYCNIETGKELGK